MNIKLIIGYWFGTAMMVVFMVLALSEEFSLLVRIMYTFGAMILGSFMLGTLIIGDD